MPNPHFAGPRKPTTVRIDTRPQLFLCYVVSAGKFVTNDPLRESASHAEFSQPAYAQTAASDNYEGTFAVAAQGFWTYSAQAYPAWGAIGVAAIGTDGISGFTDYTQQNGDGSFATTGNVALSGTENNAQGVFKLNGLNAGSFQVQGSYGYYPIDKNRVIAIQVDGRQTGQQGVLMFEAVQSN